MMKYLQEKYKWTVQHTGSINFKAISLAKNRLMHTESIRASKMMHKWLTVGRQKERINGSATDALCPCCGLEHEDQDYMFCCQCTTTRLAVKEGVSTMKGVFTRDNIPSGIAKSFTNRAKCATANPSPQLAFQCPEAWDGGGPRLAWDNGNPPQTPPQRLVPCNQANLPKVCSTT